MIKKMAESKCIQKAKTRQRSLALLQGLSVSAWTRNLFSNESIHLHAQACMSNTSLLKISFFEPSLSKPAHDELQCWKTKTESTFQERKGFSKGFTGKLANNFFIVGKAKGLCYISNHRSTSFSFSFGLQVHKVMRKTQNYNIILFLPNFEYNITYSFPAH